jgi:hypothetical protein
MARTDRDSRRCAPRGRDRSTAGAPMPPRRPRPRRPVSARAQPEWTPRPCRLSGTRPHPVAYSASRGTRCDGHCRRVRSVRRAPGRPVGSAPAACHGHAPRARPYPAPRWPPRTRAPSVQFQSSCADNGGARWYPPNRGVARGSFHRRRPVEARRPPLGRTDLPIRQALTSVHRPVTARHAVRPEHLRARRQGCARCRGQLPGRVRPIAAGGARPRPRRPSASEPTACR